MASLWLTQLECDVRGYYIALVSGTRLDIHKFRVNRSINELRRLGVNRDKIEEVLSEVAIEIL